MTLHEFVLPAEDIGSQQELCRADVPAVSVIIPLYNKAPYIKRALDSVLAQTVQDFEVVVVNDGSTDGGEKIVEGYTNPRIRLINQENQGVSAARNHGVDAARAELVAFLDADDEWLPEFLETILRLREKWPEAGLYGTGYETIFPGNHHVARVWLPGDGERAITDYFQDMLNAKSVLFNSSSFATVKNIFYLVGRYPLGVKWNEDGTLWGKIALSYFVAYSPTVQSRYYQYSQNSSQALISEYLVNPFSKYILSLPKYNLENYKNYDSLMCYVNYGEIAALSRNVINGYGKRVRKDLTTIPNEHKRVKIKIYLLSYIPKICWTLIIRYSKQLSNIKWVVKNNTSK